MGSECVKSRKAEGVVKVYGGVPGHMVWGGQGASQAYPSTTVK